MNKKELLELVETLNLPKTEYCILSGGSCVLNGIRKQTNDLDIDITPKGFEILKQSYTPELVRKDIEQYKITDKIECFLVENLEEDVIYIDNYPCQSLISMYNFKKKMNREKDQADILAIEKILNIK